LKLDLALFDSIICFGLTWFSAVWAINYVYGQVGKWASGIPQVFCVGGANRCLTQQWYLSG